MEHIEEAGIHSGDSSCVLPSVRIVRAPVDTMRTTRASSHRALGVRVAEHTVRDQGRSGYVFEVNPRASRTVPFVSKRRGFRWRASRRW